MTKNTGYFSISQKSSVKLLSARFLYAKLLLVYAFIYTLAFAVGCFMFHALDAESSPTINARINAYFDIDFSKCKNLFERANLLLDISASNISQLVIIFTAGFTMLFGIIVSFLLIFRGFSLGFSVSYFTFAIKNQTVILENPQAAIVLFSLISALCAAVMLHFTVKTAFFSDDFKALCGIPRKIIRSKALYAQLLRFLIALGAILLLNLFRCFL